MVNSSPAENLEHKYPSYSSPKPKTLPNTNRSFESWLYHNANCLITHSALHYPRPFGFSFLLLTCIFIRRLIHIQIMPNYRAGLGCFHSIFEFLMLLKYFKCVITWHINQCSTVPPHYFLSSQVSVAIHQPLHIGIFRINSIHAILLLRAPLANWTLAAHLEITSPIQSCPLSHIITVDRILAHLLFLWFSVYMFQSLGSTKCHSLCNA